jgi:1-acyl-sn-glycerol-3-phosphate acyltransferase
VFRESRDAAEAFRGAVTAIEAGECVAIYAEGTISKDPGMWPMVGKTGAARVALATGCPVIPVAQWGPEQLLPPAKGKGLQPFPRKTMRVTAGPPVDLDDLRGRPITPDVLRQATERIMREITLLLAEIRGETPPAIPFDLRKSVDTSDDQIPAIGPTSEPPDSSVRPDESPPR